MEKEGGASGGNRMGKGKKKERGKSCRSIQTDQTGYITYSWRKN